MNNLMKQMITEKIEWLREHGVLCYVGDLDSATPAEIDKLCEAIEDMTAQVVAAAGESEPWEAEDVCDCCGSCDDDDDSDPCANCEDEMRLRWVLDDCGDCGYCDDCNDDESYLEEVVRIKEFMEEDAENYIRGLYRIIGMPRDWEDIDFLDNLVEIFENMRHEYLNP